MYCSNCGMKLPDWAHFCERCGARVSMGVPEDDPLERVGANDTSSMEPLWSDVAPEPTEEREEPVVESEATQLMTEALEVPKQAQTVVFDTESDIEQVVDEGEPNDAADATRAFVPDEEPSELQEQAEPKAESEPEEEPEPHAEPEAEPDTEDESDELVEGDAADGEPGEHDQPADETVMIDSADEGAGAREPEQPVQPARNVIDVGEHDIVYGMDPSMRHVAAAETWRGRTRPSERHREERAIPMAAVAAIAALAIILSFVVAFFALGGNSSDQSGEQAEVVSTTKRVSKRKAKEIVSGLDGWWKTNRTFDGRYWHIQDGLMETYAADGVLAGQVLIDPDSIEGMTAGPGGIEGEGYYLRDIAYYLIEDDPDTLHAIGSDGTAEEDGNLVRTEAPAFMGGGSTEEPSTTPVEEGDSSEYMLPESSTRVYDVSELEGMSDHDLFVARNEIYARHGYVFEAGELSEYFESKSWYHPTDVFNEGDITEIERQNVSLILSVEQSRGSQYV